MLHSYNNHLLTNTQENPVFSQRSIIPSALKLIRNFQPMHFSRLHAIFTRLTAGQTTTALRTCSDGANVLAAEHRTGTETERRKYLFRGNEAFSIYITGGNAVRWPGLIDLESELHAWCVETKSHNHAGKGCQGRGARWLPRYLTF